MYIHSIIFAKTRYYCKANSIEARNMSLSHSELDLTIEVQGPEFPILSSLYPEFPILPYLYPEFPILPYLYPIVEGWAGRQPRAGMNGWTTCTPPETWPASITACTMSATSPWKKYINAPLTRRKTWSSGENTCARSIPYSVSNGFSIKLTKQRTELAV